MATPLTLYLPIKQDEASQQAAQAVYNSFQTSEHAVLQDSHILHYVRIALVPNLPGTPGTLAILLITTFDGAMNPYLNYFWDVPSIQQAFAALESIALNPPSPPVTDLTGFINFINANNLNQPADLYAAYPQTVKQIEAAFGSGAAA